MTPDFLALPLAIVLAFWLGSNNVSAAIGHALGSRPSDRVKLLVLFAAGTTLGVVLEGWKLKTSVLGSLVMSPVTARFSVVVFASAFILLAVGSLLGHPLSLVQSIVGGSVGAALTLGLPVNSLTLLEYSAAWVATPILSGVLTILLYVLVRRGSLATSNALAANRAVGVGSFVAAGYASYSLGVSALALIYNLVIFVDPIVPLLLAAFTILGAVVASRRVLTSFSFRLAGLTPMQALASQVSASATVHLLTQFAVPVSLVHSSLGWVLASPFTHSTSMINWRLISRIFYQWVVTPFLAASLAFLLSGPIRLLT